jgi:glycosyltransferase involved in cell wall biosynthesis
MTSDELTVFIPVRHFHPEFLRHAVRSVLAQTRADWKLLIVGDEHADEDFRPVLRGLVDDPRIRVVNRTGKNLAAAYNTAMRLASTEFIAVLLGDDMLSPNAVEVMGNAIRAMPAADFFYTGRYFIDENNQRISADYYPRSPLTLDDFARTSPVKHLMCWRVSKGLSVGGVDETLDNFGSDDYDFPWTLMEHGAVFVPVPYQLYHFRDHREAFRLTTHTTRDIQLAGLRRIIEKHNLPSSVIARRLRQAKRGFLRQSLFLNPLHRWIRERIGYNPRTGWRETYK